MEENFEERLEECNDFSDIFELVKEVAEKALGRTRAGLMLGIAELGQTAGGFIGGYHEMDSNLIVMNATPLRRIKETNSGLFKPYCFHVLLHEYLHALGFIDEEKVRSLTAGISSRFFGGSHLATMISKDVSRFMPGLIYAGLNLIPKKEPTLFIVQGFDKGNLTYVN
ncbi:MAG: hypothetical protein PHH08_03925 [Candidatus ainarchaeum sp.]|nr:hypothetical protein [Candidatus ainarchaeum sp.]